MNSILATWIVIRSTTKIDWLWIRIWRAFTAAAFTFLACGVSMAADNLEEMVVTAQKREQRLQDVPISISAFSGNRLQDSRIEGLHDLQYITPGLSVSSTNGVGFAYIRGVGSDIIGVGADASVAQYFDGVYIGRPETALMEFHDIARIEVLRGPQGTLYGRNATGGSINIVTEDPTDELEGSASVLYGDYDKLELKGVISGPLAGNLGGRLALRYAERDGFVDNLLAGDPLHTELAPVAPGFGLQDPLTVQQGSSAPDDLFDQEILQLIGKLAWAPTDSVDVLLKIDYTEDDDTGPNLKVLDESGLIFALGATQTPELYKTEIIEGVFEDQESFGISATIDFPIGPIAAKSITAYRDFTNDSLLDSDGDDLRGVDFQQNLDQDQISQEFQFTGSTDKLNWIGGLYFFHEEASWTGNVFAAFPPPFNMPPIPRYTNPPANIIFEFRSSNETDAYAAFGEVSYSVSDKLTLTGGLRYSYEEKENTGHSPPLLPEIATLEDDWGEWLPKIAVEYRSSDDLLLYGSISRGFKSGGFNSTPTSEDERVPFDPEFVWAYEAGLKSTYWDGRAQLNASIFYYDYTDLQVFAFTGLAAAVIVNAAEADPYGFELELAAQPADGLNVFFSAAYLKAEYDEFLASGAPIGQAGSVDLAGNTIRNAPEWKLTGAVEYVWPIANGSELRFWLDGSYVTEVFFDQYNKPVLRQGDLFLTNVRLAYTFPGDRWELAGFVRNISDDEYLTGGVAFAGQGFTPQGYVGEPRQWGGQLTFRF